MNIGRRTIVKTLSLISAFPGRAFAQMGDQSGPGQEVRADSAFETAFAEIKQKAIDFHQGLGYRETAPAHLVTDHRFNGGLRHDAVEALDTANPPVFVIQGIARVGDIEERERHDILPYFHVFFCNWSGEKTEATAVDETLDFLIGAVGIAPQRLALMSVEILAPHREQLAGHGIDWRRQVVIRDEAEARAAGDGSGYFRPPDHPDQLAVPSVGIYAWLGEGPPPAVDSYPLAEQWTEIGEIDFGPKAPAAQGFGLERLVYATTGLFPSWHDRRDHLLAAVEAEIATSSGTPPAGYRQFKDG